MTGFGNGPFGTGPFGGAATPAGVARLLIFPGPLSYPGTAVYPGSFQGVVPGTANITATPEPDNVPPRVLIDVTSINATSVTIWRADGNGALTTVRTGLAGDVLNLIGGGGAVYDYEAPYNTSVVYSVKTAAGAVPGTTPPVVLVATNPWLIDPGAPDLSIPLIVKVHDDVTYAASTVNLAVLGRSTPVPISDGVRKASTFTMSVKTVSVDDRSALKAVLANQSVLLLQLVYPQFTSDAEYLWISVGDLAGVRRSSTNVADTARIWTFPCTEAARPTGSVLSQWTLGDIAAAYPSLGAIDTAFLTLRGLLTDQPGT